MGARAFLALLVVPGSLVGAGPVYNVNSVADVRDAGIDGVCETVPGNGVCTLRAAVMEANLGPNPTNEEVTINLPAGTYTLTIPIGSPDDERNGDLDLTGKVRIQGVRSDLSIIDGGDLDRVFKVHPGASATFADVRIQNGNTANRYGVSDIDGGGIYSTGSVTLLRAVLFINEASGFGGGIACISGPLEITDSVISFNTAQYGAGIVAHSTTTVTGSAIHDNNGNFSGGGLRINSGPLKMTNSTVSGNHISGTGAALYLDVVQSTLLNNVTIANNDCYCGASASAIWVRGGSAVSVSVANSIFWDTTQTAEFNCESSGTNIGYFGNNITHAAGSGCIIGGSFLTSDPLLLALVWNGGPTPTHALGASSPAVGAGLPGGCVDELGATLTKDQRGVKRPIGAACDLGAFELEPKGDANGDGTVGVADVFYLINYLFAGGPLPLGRANVNGDSSIDVADVFYLINYLFAGGPAPA
jgi:hypothetical protein